MAKQIIIHAGFHKTGTTALQQSLHDNRDALQLAGLSYLVVGAGAAAHNSVLALANRGWGWKNRGRKVIPKKRWTALVGQMRKSAGTAVVSSEFFSELSEKFVAQVRNDLANIPVKIVFTLRPLDKLFPSAYTQALKAGSTKTYSEWLKVQLDDYHAAAKANFWKRNRHANVIGRWAKIFGPENVYVLFVDESQPTLLYSQFEGICGLAPQTLKPAVGKGLNRSLTFSETALLREVNAIFPQERPWLEYDLFIRRGLVRPLTNSPVTAGGKVSLLTPAWAASQIKEIAETEMELLRQLPVNFMGDIELMRSGKAPIGDNEPAVSIPIEDVAKMIVGYNLKLFSWASPKVALKAWLPFAKRRSPKWLRRIGIFGRRK